MSMHVRNARSHRKLSIEMLDRRRVLAAIAVTTLADSIDPDDGVISLREAITTANENAGSDVISLDPSLTASTGEIDLVLGELNVTDDLEINGPGSDRLTIDGQDATRIFNVTGDASLVVFRELSITGGRTTADNLVDQGITETTHHGAAVRVDSTGQLQPTVVQFESVQIGGSRTTGERASGGAIAVIHGDLEILNSTIVGNHAEGSQANGGGLLAIGSSVRLINSTVSGNTTDDVAASGGGLWIGEGSSLVMVHTTVTGNAAGAAGGLYVAADVSSVRIDNSIVAANEVIGSTSGTAIDMGSGTIDWPNDTNYTFRHSLLGDQVGTTLVESQSADADGNLIGSMAGSGRIDPMLSLIRNNGGPISTHEPLLGSPAIDSGLDSLSVDKANDALEFDQRGGPFGRFNGVVDMGSLETQPAREVPIGWADPANVLPDTLLSSEQFNASTDVPGSFSYSPPTGTVLSIGDDQTLTAVFTPDDQVHYAETTLFVLIDVVAAADHGDAPDSYGTLRDSGGPLHSGSDLRLGDVKDEEANGQPSDFADGDAGDDGVSFITSIVADPLAATVATVSVEASEVGKLDAWFDFNGDGVFDHSTEHINEGTSVDVDLGSNEITIRVPAGARAGTSYARFRFSSDGNLLPTGEAADGEVEDYRIELLDSATAPEINLSLAGNRIDLTGDADRFIVQQRGVDVFAAPRSAVGRYVIMADQFSNVLTIDSTGQNNAVPLGGIAFDGGDRVNTVRMLGSLPELDLSASGSYDFTNVDVIDISDSFVHTITIDSVAAIANDAEGAGLIVVGGDEDALVFTDPTLWRMSDPETLAGVSFNVIRSGSTFIQVDFGSGWHNFAAPSDVNNNGEITAGDALVIINELGRNTYSEPVTGQLVAVDDVDPWPGNYFDQNRDGAVTALDALRVINQLSRIDSSGSSGGEGEVLQISPSHDRFFADFFGDEDRDLLTLPLGKLF